MKISILLFFVINSQTIQAACSDPNNASGSINIPSSSLNVGSATKIGDKLGPEIVTPASTIDCIFYTPATSNFSATMYSGTRYSLKIDNRAIYATSIPGIGFAFGYEFLNYCGGGLYWAPAINCITKNSTGSDMYFKYKIHIQFYKTAIVSTGASSLSFSYPYELYIDTSTGGSNTIRSFIPLATAQPSYTILHTCLVQTPSITNINLPSISAKSLPSIGSTAAAKPFYISVNCNTPFKIGMTFTDNNKPTQTTAVLKFKMPIEVFAEHLDAVIESRQAVKH